jgi:hypothetical protein
MNITLDANALAAVKMIVLGFTYVCTLGVAGVVLFWIWHAKED